MNEEELNKIIGSKLKYVREKGQAFSEIDLDSVEDCIKATYILATEDVLKKIDEWFKHLKGNSVYLKQIEELKVSLKTSEEKQDDN